MEDKVENSSDQREMGSQEIPRRQEGGLITIPFIIANEAFEKIASYGLVSNMILYLIKNYHMSVAKGTSVIFIWTAATSFMPLLGAFLSDSYLGRFLTIGFGSITSLLGIVLLWLTAMVPESKPPPCIPSSLTCRSPTAAQLTHLFSSLALISIGAGGVRPCSIAFGADQLERRDNSKHQGILESFFGWYYASSFLAVLIALTGIVYLQDHIGWKVGFGVPAVLMFVATIVFFIASPLYLKKKPKKSLFTGLAQVIVVSYRNRNLSFPSTNSREHYHHNGDSKIVVPSDKLRFLNKACIIRNPEQDIGPDGLAVDPWRLCTIEQVEELKALIKVLPVWSTGIMLSITASQSSFMLLQASSMDRHISQRFQIPAASFATFGLIIMVIWVILYDRVILPLASKIKGKPVQLSVKLRMGIGLFLSWMAMVVSAIIESIRRGKAIQEGYLNNASAVLDMSAMWLVPQYCLLGLAEAFTAIGQTEFFYTELPKSLSSIAASLFGLGMAVANLLSTVVVSTVNDLTSRGGKESWVSSNINKGHYNYYYWVLAVMSFINLLYFLLCSWAYGPCGEQVTKVRDTGNDSKKEEALPNLVGIRLKEDEK
ncbi:hypothetical protein SLEP1_g26898 [Rubroshorea leprosula]|uniref:NPF family transporter n=1 Tax=Rubroshorea leprosula TaxID=152421 RepID=A0AAV5JZC2_9ROSI|nr:hypothetical protein SLEP1_g26898 [Rubroshorea leprosula]